MTDCTDDHAEDSGYISKSQRKRDSLALQDLARDIVHLKPTLIQKLPLPEHIIDAFLAARPMKMGALKRQVQLIGKYLREEEDLAPLYLALTHHLKKHLQ